MSGSWVCIESSGAMVSPPLFIRPFPRYAVVKTLSVGDGRPNAGSPYVDAQFHRIQWQPYPLKNGKWISGKRKHHWMGRFPILWQTHMRIFDPLANIPLPTSLGKSRYNETNLCNNVPGAASVPSSPNFVHVWRRVINHLISCIVGNTLWKNSRVMVASSLSCEQNQLRRQFAPLRVTIEIVVPFFVLKICHDFGGESFTNVTPSNDIFYLVAHPT